MIREGDRIAVGVSGGKDSMALLEAPRVLQRKSPVSFEIEAFTVEQGKFLRPIDPLGDYMKAWDIPWTYYRDEPSFQLLDRRFLDLESGEDALEFRSREPAELLPVLSPDTL